jgi:hypothetical protein
LHDSAGHVLARSPALRPRRDQPELATVDGHGLDAHDRLAAAGGWLFDLARFERALGISSRD